MVIPVKRRRQVPALFVLAPVDTQDAKCHHESRRRAEPEDTLHRLPRPVRQSVRILMFDAGPMFDLVVSEFLQNFQPPCLLFNRLRCSLEPLKCGVVRSDDEGAAKEVLLELSDESDDNE